MTAVLRSQAQRLLDGFAVPGYNKSLLLKVQHLGDYDVGSNASGPLWYSTVYSLSTLPLLFGIEMINVLPGPSDSVSIGVGQEWKMFAMQTPTFQAHSLEKNVSKWVVWIATLEDQRRRVRMADCSNPPSEAGNQAILA